MNKTTITTELDTLLTFKRELQTIPNRMNTIRINNILIILANYRNENVSHYNTEQVKGYTFINTVGHGYLVLGSDDNGYSDGLAIARASNYSYVLDGGLVYLEEDEDATKFLKNMGL